MIQNLLAITDKCKDVSKLCLSKPHIYKMKTIKYEKPFVFNETAFFKTQSTIVCECFCKISAPRIVSMMSKTDCSIR